MISITTLLSLFLLVLTDSSISVCVPSATQCGCSQIRPLFSQSKIVGGYAARYHSWPWMVSFRRGRKNASATDPGVAFCGGTLINSQYVLTAAHCFASVTALQLSRYFAVIGAYYVNDTNPIQYTIKSVTIHREYNDETYDNDIAVIKLNYQANFSDSTVGFVCLPPANVANYPNEPLNGTALGWGYLEQGGSLSYTLQQVTLPIISYANEDCADVVANDTIQFCAGVLEGGKDTCQGDSGGPLLIYNSTSDSWNIAGVTSYGYGCAQARYPGVYTRVSMYINWINAVTNGNTSGNSNTSMKLILNGLLFYTLFIILHTLI